MKDKLLIFTDSLAGRQYAAREGRTCHTDVLGFEEAYGSLCALRKTYSTHVEGLFPLKGGEVIITADVGEEKLSGMVAMAAAAGFDIEVAENQNAAVRPGRLLSEEPIIKTEDLAGARLVFLGGKGLGKKENFQRLEAVAKKLGASCGCTRPVALSGWTGFDKVVGLSGATLTADVCIAFGVSGAGPLMQGAGGAARLIAINNDPKAPIFSRCTDGIVADCLEVLAALEQLAGIE